jgi:hypothetical protein
VEVLLLSGKTFVNAPAPETAPTPNPSPCAGEGSTKVAAARTKVAAARGPFGMTKKQERQTGASDMRIQAMTAVSIKESADWTER